MKIAAALALLLAIACGGPPPATPAPPPTVPDAPERVWGEPANGLAIGLAFDRATYGPEDRITVTVAAKNTGTSDFTLYGFLEDWIYHVRFDNVDGGPAFLGGSGTFIEYEGPQNHVLRAGEEWKTTVGLSEEHRRYLREIPDRKPGDDWDYRGSLPAGRWRATLTFARTAPSGGAAADPPYWAGRAVSNTPEITVTE